jgi:hypothetical protein
VAQRNQDVVAGMSGGPVSRWPISCDHRQQKQARNKSAEFGKICNEPPSPTSYGLTDPALACAASRFRFDEIAASVDLALLEYFKGIALSPAELHWG